MSAPGVTVDGVWKAFVAAARADTLRDLLGGIGRGLVRRRRGSDDMAGRADGRGDGVRWALRDLSFEVGAGEALALIGPNGAGKSTALRLLAGILPPTRGHIEVRGRIGALIEIAAAFHGDLSGRDNVYLQGAIMGMRRAEVARSFEAIFAFGDLDEFVDTPVKHYSTGMAARLAFSIAAHLEPDVLLIDELLAVGDAVFQQRAFARLQELVRQRGTPTVVVSHQLDRLAALCSRALVLDRGRTLLVGTPAECIAAYVGRMDPGPSSAHETTSDGSPLRLSALRAEGGAVVASGDWLRLRLEAHAERIPDPAWMLVIRVRSSATGEAVFTTTTARCGIRLERSGCLRLAVELQMNVPAGLYLVETEARDFLQQCSLGAGPWLAITVDEGGNFIGSIQMNPRIAVLGS